MAQMTNEQLYQYLVNQGMVQQGRNPGTLSVGLGDNTGYVVELAEPPGFRESQIADVANPAGFNTPYVVPADWMPTIQRSTYVPDWMQATKNADNGGFLADYGWMLPLAIAGGGMLAGGLGGTGAATAGAAGAAEAGAGGLSWLGNSGLATIPEAVAGMGAGTAAAGTGAGLSWLGNEGLASIPEAVSGMQAGTAAAGYSAADVLNAASVAASAGGGGAASLIPGFTNSQLLSGGMSLVGGLLSGAANQGAANTSANAQLEAARIAADAAKFRPVGVTTRFGQSQFQKDANGNVIGAGYTLSPDVKAQQDQLMAASGGMLNQFTGSQAATAPMGQAAQTMFGLGQGYLATDPQAQAAKYLADQQALLATGRERDLTSLENRLFSQGRLGLATGGTSTGMMAANPEMEALRNAQKQQDLALAAQATQGGMDYAKFGAGMVGSGGDMLTSMYNTQSAAYKPYQTAMGGAQYLEGLGQQPLTLGMDIGRQVTSGTAQAGGLLAQGMTNAAQTQQAGSYSPFGTALMAGGNMLGTMAQPQQQAQQQLTQQQMLNPGSFYPTNNVNAMGNEWNWRGNWS
jgi:hypothetical protein